MVVLRRPFNVVLFRGDDSAVLSFACKSACRYRIALLQTIKDLNGRIRWCSLGTRRIFGCVSGDFVTLICDTSKDTESHLRQLKDHLCTLLATFVHKEGFNIIRYVSEMVSL